MRRVIVESPFAAVSARARRDNITYARACMHDCFSRGEAPLASHLLYTQPGVLRDAVPGERALGIAAGLAWGDVADATVVYTDFGISAGMHHGINRAEMDGRPVEYRKLNGEAKP